MATQYTYRTTKDRNGQFAAIVCRVENDLHSIVTSRALHNSRSRAYKAARAMANAQTNDNPAATCAAISDSRINA